MWYTIIGLACIGVLWINSEPTIRLRELILGNHQGVFRRLLECAMCSTFYIATLYLLLCGQQFDLLLICSSSVLAELLSQKLNNQI